MQIEQVDIGMVEPGDYVMVIVAQGTVEQVGTKYITIDGEQIDFTENQIARLT